MAGHGTARHSKGLFSNIWLWRAVAGVLTAAVILISCIQFANPSPAKDLPECPPLELCPSGWLYFQRKCYYLSEREDAWNSSQSHCSSHNASLLVIENHQELERLDGGFAFVLEQGLCILIAGLNMQLFSCGFVPAELYDEDNKARPMDWTV